MDRAAASVVAVVRTFDVMLPLTAHHLKLTVDLRQGNG